MLQQHLLNYDEDVRNRMSVGFKRVLKMLLERIDQAIDTKCKIIASEVVDEYLEQKEAAKK